MISEYQNKVHQLDQTREMVILREQQLEAAAAALGDAQARMGEISGQMRAEHVARHEQATKRYELAGISADVTSPPLAMGPAVFVNAASDTLQAAYGEAVAAAEEAARYSTWLGQQLQYLRAKAEGIESWLASNPEPAPATSRRKRGWR